ncbi:MAG: HAMP domain-containing histidine kinase [Gammaproteobacteria bacterium]|nr:HAMP domain-containing histidine kinase [Gammaproteobacteria bacterium]MDH5799688.1 HAMP domain-containing histidine kinase [Gammaproteobacteria bacterium]
MKQVFNKSSLLRNYLVFVLILMTLIAGMLAWVGGVRQMAFEQKHYELGREAIQGVRQQAALYISEKRRMVEAISHSHADAIRGLFGHPDNDTLHQYLDEALGRHFRDYFAFSVADSLGVPRFEDFDGLISELCLTDIKTFSSTKTQYQPYIHPNAEGYHFDIMVRFVMEDEGEKTVEGIFFVSFLAAVLGDIINNIQGPDQKIMLVLPLERDLIEVVATGARNQWEREDYRLSPEEAGLISSRLDVPGTRWQVVDFRNPVLFENHRKALIWESGAIFLAFMLIALFLLHRLKRTEDRRQQAERQKQVLMSYVGHEFRTPVAVVKSALDLVLDGDAGQINDVVRKYINVAISSTESLLVLVDDFMDIQKIETGNLRLNKQEHRLSQIIESAVNKNALFAKQFSARYTLKKPMPDDKVFCDAHRIEQVLNNILSNAAKYGGAVDTIRVGLCRREDLLRVSVSDHGSGIQKEFQTRVFEKFTMAREGRRDGKVGSSGLGLSIAKAIVEMHGGNIGFSTHTNAGSPTGTTFWVELPILQQ